MSHVGRMKVDDDDHLAKRGVSSSMSSHRMVMTSEAQFPTSRPILPIRLRRLGFGWRKSRLASDASFHYYSTCIVPCIKKNISVPAYWKVTIA